MRAANDRRARLWTLLSVLACTAASPLVHGYAFGLENQNIQLPHVLATLDPGLYPGDPLVDAMGSYFSFFWSAMAWLGGRLPLEGLFFGLHLLIVAAKFTAVRSLTERLFPGDARAVHLALWFVFWGRSGIGWEPLHWNYLAHTPAATAIGLWTLVAVLGGRPLLALALAGFVFNVHAMQSAYLLLMIACVGLAEGPRVWRRYLSGLPLYVLAALPGLYWMFTTEALDSPPDLVDLIRIFFPFHFFVSSFGAGQWLTLGLLLGIYAAAWKWAPGRPAIRRARVMVGALFLFWIAGGAIMEWAPNALVLKLHVFRSSSYVCFLLFSTLGGLVAAAWRLADERSVPPVFVWSLLLWIVPLGAAEHELLGNRPMLVAFAVTPLLLFGVFAVDRLRVAAGTLALLSSACVFLWSVAERREASRLLLVHQQPWREAQVWARENSSPDERFLTPPYLAGFRIHSRRAVVGEVQDGSALLWSSTYAAYWRVWYERMGCAFDGEDITLWDRLARHWFEKDQAEIEAIARDYGAAFIVLREPRSRERALGWHLDWVGEALFDNGVFRVYRTSEEQDAATGG